MVTEAPSSELIKRSNLSKKERKCIEVSVSVKKKKKLCTEVSKWLRLHVGRHGVVERNQDRELSDKRRETRTAGEKGRWTLEQGAAG